MCTCVHVHILLYKNVKLFVLPVRVEKKAKLVGDLSREVCGVLLHALSGGVDGEVTMNWNERKYVNTLYKKGKSSIHACSKNFHFFLS